MQTIHSLSLSRLEAMTDMVLSLPLSRVSGRESVDQSYLNASL